MSTPYRQRGAASLLITLVMLFVMSLVVAYTNRNLLVEQKASANQYRSTQAFEAAEAGLEWALALLNSGERLGADCQPSVAPGSASLRERYLEYVPATASFIPRTWVAGGSNLALQPACVRTDAGWSCSCPSDGHPTLVTAAGSPAAPAFALQFVAAGRSGMLHVVATGCDRVVAPCIPGADGGAAGGAHAQLHLTLGLLPALAKPPAAALTALANVSAGGELGLSHADPRDAMFSSYLGLDKAHWQQQPGVRSITCHASCESELAFALGPDATHPMVWVNGDLRLSGAVTLGSPEHPVLLVVEGQLQLSDGVLVYGLIYSLASHWDTSGSHHAQVHGAVVAQGDVLGDGTPELIYDAAILARLHGNVGTFTRVPGSWRDF